MYARSFDFNSGSLPPLSYSNNYGYNSDSVSLPSVSPYSFSYNQPSPYSYQPKPQYIQKSPQYQPKDQFNKNSTNKANDQKTFIDTFDNNNSGLFAQNKSYARNIKGRLLSNEDPNAQKAKSQKVQSYREQLQRQIEQTRKRKQEQKQKIQKQELQRQRKFYQEFKIKAQTKQNKQGQKDDNGYFMARTIHKFKKSKPEQSEVSPPKQEPPPVNKLVVPKGRGRMYLNKSSLDHFDEDYATVTKQYIHQQPQQIPYDGERPKKVYKDNRLTRMEQQLIRQRSTEEQRLSKLLLFQQRVLQKINDIKVQIRNTSFDVDGQKQLQRIRNSLRARPIPFDDDFNRSMTKKSNQDMSQFYSLPKRQLRTVPPTRYSVKLKDSNSKQSPQKSVKSETHQILNDKNFTSSPNIQENQEEVE